MPYAEEGARDCGQRVGGKVDCGQAAGQSRVLHTHLDGDGSLLGFRQLEQSSYQIAAAESAEVVENDYQDDHQSTGQQFAGIGTNDDGHDE